MKLQTLLTVPVLAIGMFLAGCAGGDAPTKADVGEASTSATTSESAPAPTGDVIEIKMVTDGAGNYFEPKEANVKKGDVVRFVLVSGVHNVSFPSSLNEGKSTLPDASPYLQLPGQTWDLVVDMDAGEYNYQCDPHVALGMFGTLIVE